MSSVFQNFVALFFYPSLHLIIGCLKTLLYPSCSIHTTTFLRIHVFVLSHHRTTMHPHYSATALFCHHFDNPLSKKNQSFSATASHRLCAPAPPSLCVSPALLCHVSPPRFYTYVLLALCATALPHLGITAPLLFRSSPSSRFCDFAPSLFRAPPCSLRAASTSPHSYNSTPLYLCTFAAP